MKEQKVKKPIYKKWWFYVLVVFILLGAVGGGGKKEAAPAPAPAETPAPVEATPAPELSVLLDASQAGEYGREVILNAGKADETKFYGYFFPAGHYRATYTAGKAWAQLTFYMEGTAVNSYGVEEPVMSDKKPILANVGEPVEFDLVDGEYIKLPDGQQNVLIEKIG
jgi:hypothetical protein